MTSRHAAGKTPEARRGHDRRSFLKGASLATAASATASIGLTPAAADVATFGPFFSEPPTDAAPLPEVTLGGHKVPRMILGCNPIGGWAHAVPNLARTMQEYFTEDVTHDFLQHAESWGLDTWLTYWGPKPLAALRRRWEGGSKMRVYFLAKMDEDGRIAGAESREVGNIMDYKPLFLVHHGGVTDRLFRAGQQERVHDFLKKAHDMGVPAGVSAHNPEVFRHIEDRGWECDLYQCCLYYVTRPKEEIRARLGTAMLGEPFLEKDRDDMVEVIRTVSKPCIAFKILGAGRLCNSPAAVAEAFQYALSRIKKTDAVIVGMWPRFKDEIAENVGLLRQYGAA
jgi:hypothetical protein